MIDWKEYIANCVSVDECPRFSVRHDALGQFEPTVISKVNKHIVKDALNSGYKGVAICVCDYTREALLFCVESALEHALQQKRTEPIDWNNLPAGSKLSLGPVVVEFEKVTSENTGSRSGIDYFWFKQPEGGRRKKAEGKTTGSNISGLPLSRIPFMHLCPQDTDPTTNHSKPLSKEIEEYKSLPTTVQQLRDSYSLASGAIGFGSSHSPLANVPPSALKNLEIGFDGSWIPVSQLFKTGRISNGEIHRNSLSYPTEGEYSLLAASRRIEGVADPFDFIEYAEEGNNLRAAVFEVPSAESFQIQVEEIRDLVDDFDIPVVVFCDEEAFRNKRAFEDIGLMAFSWTTSMLKELNNMPDELGDLRLSKNELNAANPIIKYQVVEDDGRFAVCAEALNKLKTNKSLLSENELLALSSLVRAYNHALKRTEMISESESEQILSSIQDASKILAGSGGSYSLSPEEAEYVREVAVILQALSLPNIALPKENIAYEMISHAIDVMGKDAHLIVSSDNSAKSSMNYWIEALEDEELDSSSLTVYTPRRFTKVPSMNDDCEVLVSGWFFDSEMRKILYSGIAKSFTILLYRDCSNELLETKYYRENTRYWEQGERKMIEASASSLASIGVKMDVPKQAAKPSSANRYKTMDEALREIQEDLSARQRASDGEEVAIGRPVWFSNGLRRWLRVSDRGGDSLLVITNVIEEQGEYSRKAAPELEIGDLVLKTESDENALSEACRLFGSFEKTHELAYSWYEPIREAKKHFSDRQIRQRVISAGCKRTIPTIDRWISGKTKIAPEEPEDIRAIYSALGSSIDDEMLKKISKAASLCFAGRIKSGRKVKQSIAEAFAEDAKTYESIDLAAKRFETNHPGLGKVEVLRVEYIGEPQVVSTSQFGWYQK